MLRLGRFLRCYLNDPAPGVREEEVTLPVGERASPALLFRPLGARPLPGWVLLHGITVPGMRHPALLRFARAIAGAGGVVLVPEVEAWKRLVIDPARADVTISAAARLLAGREGVREGGVGVVGFSFGATQALVSAARGGRDSGIRSVVAFGGYCDLRRTIEFMLTGEHEWRGAVHRLEPDPYGRWIVAANFLADAPGFSGMEAVATAARELAAEAGRRGTFAGDPLYDPLKEELGSGLGREERGVWRLIAPPVGARPDAARARSLAEALVEAALRRHPALDPRPALPALTTRVVLAHGHHDRLIPYTETLRLASHLSPSADALVRITRLFAHSGGAEGISWGRYPIEVWRYATLLHRALKG